MNYKHEKHSQLLAIVSTEQYHQSINFTIYFFWWKEVPINKVRIELHCIFWTSGELCWKLQAKYEYVKHLNMILREVLDLHNQTYVYAIENDEGVFLFRWKHTNRLSITVRCRTRRCNKYLRLLPIKDVRYNFLGSFIL